MKSIVYFNDATSSVVVTAIDYRMKRGDETEDAFALRVKQSDCPPHAIVVDNADLPATSADFWEIQGDKVVLSVDRGRAARKWDLLVVRDAIVKRLRERWVELDEDGDLQGKKKVRDRILKLRSLDARIDEMLAGVTMTNLMTWVPPEFKE
jgi:hypothetical protein